MQTMLHIRKSLLILFILALINPSWLPAATEQRTALIIGNSAYNSGPLKNPVNDASDMAAQLRDLGFMVILKRDADLRAMDEAFAEFGDRLKRGGVGLFYYAGHGLQIGGVNYLIPIGARINRESDVKYEAMDAGKILDEMANANNGMNIVLLDACRDNPFVRSFRNATRGLSIVSNAPVGTFISYSTSPGQVARDGEGRNSPYTSALLQYIREPGIPITEMFMKVRQKLRQETGQIPWELSSLEGKFVFVPGSVGQELSGDQPSKPQAEKEPPRVQSNVAPSFTDLKKKMVEKQASEKQWTADFEDAKKMEQMSSSLSEKIEVWRQLMAAIPGERSSNVDEIQRYASNRLAMLERWRAIGKTPPKELKADGRFVAYDDGTVLDTRTNLMWASRDNGASVQQPKTDFFSLLTMEKDSEKSKRYHSAAKRYCEDYRGGGYTDWRMPTRDELQSLYDRGKYTSASDRRSHIVTDLINVRVIWTWSSETKNNSECYGAFFNMNSGGGSFYCPGDLIMPAALPVRTAGEVNLKLNAEQLNQGVGEVDPNKEKQLEIEMIKRLQEKQ